MSCTDRSGRFAGMLLSYAEDALDTMSRNEMRGHVEECPDCRARLDEIQMFLTMMSFVDKKAWGEKTPCLSAEDMSCMSTSPSLMPPEQLDAAKKHLLECMKCNMLFKRLINLNQQMQNPEFESRNVVPGKLKRRLVRVIRDHVRSGVVTGKPVTFAFDGLVASVDPERFRQVTGRDAPQSQEAVPVLAGDISGTMCDDAGSPLGREWVLLYRNNTSVCRVRTDQYGGFRFRNLVQGIYEVRARAGRTVVVLGKEPRHEHRR